MWARGTSRLWATTGKNAVQAYRRLQYKPFSSLPSWACVGSATLAGLAVASSCSQTAFPTEGLFDVVREKRTNAEYPRVIRMMGSTFEYAGCGVRAMLGMFPAYCYGLYVDREDCDRFLRESRAQLPEDGLFSLLLEPRFTKAIRFLCVRDVTGSHMIRGFAGALQKRVKSLHASGMPNADVALQSFLDLFKDRHYKNGDELYFVFTRQGAVVPILAGEEMTPIRNPTFARALMDMFVGETPSSEEARESIREELRGLQSNWDQH